MRFIEAELKFRGDKVLVYIIPWPLILKNERNETLNFNFSFKVTYLVNLNKKQFYFTDQHDVPKSLQDEYWVPVSVSIPQVAKSRECIPTGFVTCLEDLVNVYLNDYQYKGVI